MSDALPSHGAPISWGSAPESETDRKVERERVLGFRAAQIGAAAWLPDDPLGIGPAISDDGRPFHGAFVPLVIHDPVLAERSFDAAEFAADLIASERGGLLCITPFAAQEWVVGTPLSPRQWNHAAAMLERLDELCGRYKLQAIVSEMVDEQQVRAEAAPPDDKPVHYVLDTGNFLPDGFVPTVLVSPEKVVDGDEPLAERLRGYLRGRTAGR